MSRIGRKPVAVPAGTKVVIDGCKVTAEGPKGTLTKTFNPQMTIKLEDGHVVIERADDEKETRALHGLTRALIHNMVEGVTNGYSKELEVVGVGYRAAMQGKDLLLNLGYSHQILYKAADGITLSIIGAQQNHILVSGPDKESVGQSAAEIREKREPDHYNVGKGIRYLGEHVRHKEGKAGKK
ncbi:MAG TPA: 50S ribosomal protein L6 [Oscillospiraceae bacterium]|nr:50S ribosomal protein L6 [Oscillospiraceae bacterium]HPS34249.1 50S ribosomal protein L6 [Oscillospiraceae bacterium]